jgi:ankyrin repeat protein
VLDDEHGNSALHVAVMLENAEMVETLVALGALPTAHNHYGMTPLHMAAALPGLTILKRLVEHGNVSNLNLLDSRGNPPLFYAVNAGRLQNVKYLHSVQVELTLANTAGFTAAHIAVCSFSVQILQFLQEAGAPLDTEARDSLTPIKIAAAVGSMDCFLMLWELPSSQSPVVQSAVLALAASGGHLAIIRWIFNAVFGAKAATSEQSEATVNETLKQALTYNQPEVVNWLLFEERYVALLHIGQQSWLLHRAVEFGMVGVVARLLELGAEANATDENGMTPLLIAGLTGQVKLVHSLIEKGANLRARDNRDYGVLHHACRSERAEGVISALLDLGLSPNEHNKNGESPLMVAVGQANGAAVRLLVGHVRSSLAPRDPLGALGLWSQGPYLQAVTELLDSEFVPDRGPPLLKTPTHSYLTGTYMGLPVLAMQHRAPVNMRAFSDQISLVNHLRHRNLVSFLGAFQDGDSASYVQVKSAMILQHFFYIV